MYAHSNALPARRSPALQPLLFAALFWLFTYALLSVRAEMLLGNAFELLSARRLLGTTAGAAACWAVLAWMRGGRSGRPVAPAAILATILPATIFVLAACLAVEHLWYETPLPLQATLRWVMAWSGYFGLWVSASLAFQIHRAGRAAAPAVRAPSVVAPAAAIAAAPPAPADPEAWEWLVDACAAELAALPEPDHTALAQRLVQAAGYEQADDPLGTANARVELAGRIAARVAASPGSSRKG